MYSAKGLGVICRLNNAAAGRDHPAQQPLSRIAQRVANFVERSCGCNKWIIGNEMNYAVERPGIVIDWSRHASVRGGTPQESDLAAPRFAGTIQRDAGLLDGDPDDAGGDR